MAKIIFFDDYRKKQPKRKIRFNPYKLRLNIRTLANGFRNPKAVVEMWNRGLDPA
jgi:hypothetical protein